MDRHVVLVGMMGTGKTAAGRRLAARLGWPVVDLDEELERRSGRSVRAWFAERGEEAFRAAEADVLAQVLDAPVPAVVSAGGGVVCLAANRARLRAGDVAVVWLDAEPSFLAARLQAAGGVEDRPLLDEDPRAALERLSAERRGWYHEVADLTISVERLAHRRPGEAPVDLVAEVLAQLEARSLLDPGAT